MKTFNVTVEEVTDVTYKVKANSLEDVKRMIETDDISDKGVLVDRSFKESSSYDNHYILCLDTKEFYHRSECGVIETGVIE